MPRKPGLFPGAEGRGAGGASRPVSPGSGKLRLPRGPFRDESDLLRPSHDDVRRRGDWYVHARSIFESSVTGGWGAGGGAAVSVTGNAGGLNTYRRRVIRAIHLDVVSDGSLWPVIRRVDRRVTRGSCPLSPRSFSPRTLTFARGRFLGNSVAPVTIQRRGSPFSPSPRRGPPTPSLYCFW